MNAKSCQKNMKVNLKKQIIQIFVPKPKYWVFMIDITKPLDMTRVPSASLVPDTLTFLTHAGQKYN